jgi:CBS domain-containing protein
MRRNIKPAARAKKLAHRPPRPLFCSCLKQTDERSLPMLVRDLLDAKESRPMVVAAPETTAHEAMTLLIDNKISCLPVMKGNELVGIVSDKDIFKLIFEHRTDFADISVKDIMTSDLIVGVMDDEIDYIAGVMSENRIRHVPIMDGKKLLGLVSQTDIVKRQMKHMKVENRYLRIYIDGFKPH